MLNRPFSSSNFNIFEEKTQNTTPASICGQNVLVSQEQHRRTFDTLTTTIAGNSPYYPYLTQQTYGGPNAVTFTFGKSPQWNYQHQWQDPMLNLNQLQQKNAIELLSLQRQLGQQQPCLLRFHLDGQTSTTDLLTNPNGQRVGSVVDELLQNERERKVNFDLGDEDRKTPIQEGRTGNEEEKTAVSDEPKNAEIQAHVCCSCCNCDDVTAQKKKKCKRRKSKKKKNNAQSGESGSENNTDNTDTEEDDDIR